MCDGINETQDNVNEMRLCMMTLDNIQERLNTPVRLMAGRRLTHLFKKLVFKDTPYVEDLVSFYTKKKWTEFFYPEHNVVSYGDSFSTRQLRTGDYFSVLNIGLLTVAIPSDELELAIRYIELTGAEDFDKAMSYSELKYYIDTVSLKESFYVYRRIALGAKDDFRTFTNILNSYLYLLEKNHTLAAVSE